MDLGGQEQALRQAKINAPLTTATNAAQLLRGYTVPTSTAQEYKGPLPGAYSASPLQQIAGLGALFASGAGGTSPFQGFQKALNSALSSPNSGVGTIFPGLDPTFNYEGVVQDGGVGST